MTGIKNGQPGRISKLESLVTKLMEFRYWLVGVAAGVSATVSATAWLVAHLWKE